MLWNHYVYRRGDGVHDLWGPLFKRRPMRLLYIAGKGFDVRAQVVLRECVASIRSSGQVVEAASLTLVAVKGYELDPALLALTEVNAAALETIFAPLGASQSVAISAAATEESEISATQAIRLGVDAVLRQVTDQTDIILDVSSIPRVVYLALMTSILNRLVPRKKEENALSQCGVNFQVVVAEDAGLDAQILAEDPSSDPVLVPGFSSAVQAESVQDWPLVWFPILGEHRVNQLLQILKSNVIPDQAEICPVLPHPSSNPRRADRLLLEYKEPLFDQRETPTSNILHAHESNPFEAYRQLLQAMIRYRDSLRILGGCRLVVSPLGSKLITLGAGLACFDMRPDDLSAQYGIAIPHAEPTRYVASVEALTSSRPGISALLLTGEAYAP
ncbi:hypothetical protein [Hyphomicrobium sp.]|uniref:hypothetical protein n=1 Tax=Hyphomicrobium sp. TaxID=82 RepID=UPI0025C46E33|nr:hypothetical protein [Hyphomicrobium sp.]MCC7253628.1 hypothetical protein [Hyphomicrobium sp.]